MEIRTAIFKYCNYQERCQEEVRTRLLGLGADMEYANLLIADLIEANLLNEERFAKSYTRGKFGQKKWGRNKIRQGLKVKRISDYCIRKGLGEIEPDDYFRVLSSLCERALEKFQRDPEWIRKAKTVRYLVGKGYENDLVQDALIKITSQP